MHRVWQDWRVPSEAAGQRSYSIFNLQEVPSQSALGAAQLAVCCVVTTQLCVSSDSQGKILVAREVVWRTWPFTCRHVSKSWCCLCRCTAIPWVQERLVRENLFVDLEGVSGKKLLSKGQKTKKRRLSAG